MKVLGVGDPHGVLLKRTPKNIDLILVTGDVGKADLARQRVFENLERKRKKLSELEEDKKFIKNVFMEIHNSTIKVLKNLSKSAPVYTIQGNVGIPTFSDVRKNKEKYGITLPCTKKQIDVMSRAKIVKNRLKILNDLRVGFLEYFVDTSWVREFKPTDYKKKLSDAKKQTDKAKKILKRFGKIDILVCHQPPYGNLDKVTAKFAPKLWRGKHAGSKVILDYIKKYQPKYVFCGHIHEGEGKKKIGKTEVYNLGVGSHVLLDIE
ncbi:MAG: metallophosphoesterase [Nanoarchaeota archaeon]|nr:metallophosphoesterase [Nanoarchaeota archaeon]